MLNAVIGAALCSFAKLITGVRPVWQAQPPEGQCVFFANHRSHGDFLLIWAALPAVRRVHTRPVAGADYWLRGALRRYVAQDVFRAVLIERNGRAASSDPVGQMAAALSGGDSLIVFPEGTRNLGDGLLPFKSGIYHLAAANPQVEFVPVWIENLGRVMPKGALIPVPLLCTLSFGPALRLADGEGKREFLDRAQAALAALAPPEG
ncbi:lysophospholipid acyltransferase family protein [Pseudothauera lacus]|uniref:1-acyl-sn-glycerol-3-phosphate acyltransferase n=1 Tax=Pseudothauera lacus TaxID=2136175 RepID=A0A2T4IK82_9RHOO|nr:lysophospholipid acyltransferase family protein [Pseudothauera lacus]PTD98187.1 1-acyl-sn-glycerol-3-phosphate acyltransferase [Pseudothauera lacus]